jgi:hypothetical protein
VRDARFPGRFCHQIAVMMSDPGNSFFTLIPHCNPRGSVGFTMKLMRFCVVSLGCVAGAVTFGVVANAAIDLVMPPGPKEIAFPTGAIQAVATPAEVAAERPAAFALASATSTPVDLGPAKVKVVPIIVRDGQFTELTNEAPAAPVVGAAVPLPRPRPAAAPTHETASLARQPGSLAISAATRKANPDDGDPLGAAGIERMKTALALTSEQEEYWPAIAAELRALGKALKTAKGQAGNVTIDGDTMQRLYYAAAPLISRLSYEQKLKVKQMAHVMGLHQVAQAL